MSAITKYLPRNHLSYFIGKLVHWRGPRFWAQLTIEIFASIYKINLSEAELPIQAYPSLGDFFVRKLKPGRRPISADSAVVHPADSEISQHGPIIEGRLIQAKGREYFLQELLANAEAPARYENGYFVTYYLCPTDYHRVHSPVDGDIQRVTHVPGELWPVNKWSVENIHGLFSVNERIIVELATELGPVAVVFVGATNVGQIVLSFDASFRGNQLKLTENRVVEYGEPIKVKKGQELGMFRMGSTVVVVYGEGLRHLYPAEPLRLDRYVRYGQAFSRASQPLPPQKK
jgi:phosphatidylserine decarboxylase